MAKNNSFARDEEKATYPDKAWKDLLVAAGYSPEEIREGVEVLSLNYVQGMYYLLPPEDFANAFTSEVKRIKDTTNPRSGNFAKDLLRARLVTLGKLKVEPEVFDSMSLLAGRPIPKGPLESLLLSNGHGEEEKPGLDTSVPHFDKRMSSEELARRLGKTLTVDSGHNGIIGTGEYMSALESFYEPEDVKAKPKGKLWLIPVPEVQDDVYFPVGVESDAVHIRWMISGLVKLLIPENDQAMMRPVNYEVWRVCPGITANLMLMLCNTTDQDPAKILGKVEKMYDRLHETAKYRFVFSFTYLDEETLRRCIEDGLFVGQYIKE